MSEPAARFAEDIGRRGLLMKRVLVIDDDESLRGTIREILEEAGYEVDEAKDGREGVNRYQAVLPDLVLTDIVMPEQDGLEIIFTLMRDHPGTNVVAMSGKTRFGAADFLDYARKFGTHETPVKPFRRNELLTVVRRTLAGGSSVRSCGPGAGRIGRIGIGFLILGSWPLTLDA